MARKTKTKAAPIDPVFSSDSESEAGSAKEDIDISEPPTTIDPYSVLSVPSTATPEEIKTAYRKLALKHHPDKVSPSERDGAHKKFQEIAFAYGILSDERRRKRYDATGNTAESANVDDDDFNWTDFFREMSAQVINGELIDQVKREYQGSEEERDDILAAYEDSQGDLDGVFERVMCSEVLVDEERFRKIIDAAIAAGEIEAYAKYTKEGKKKRDKRQSRAQNEAQEAMKLAEELGVKDKLFGGSGGKGNSGADMKSSGSKKKKSQAKDADGDGDTAGLMALIQQRQKSRTANFLDDLEARYGGGAGKKNGAGKRKLEDEPPEEAFLKNAKRGRKGVRA